MDKKKVRMVNPFTGKVEGPILEITSSKLRSGSKTDVLLDFINQAKKLCKSGAKENTPNHG